MSGGVRTCFHFPPYNHSLRPCEDTAFDFVGHTPRQLRECAKARHNGHDGPLPSAALARRIFEST